MVEVKGPSMLEKVCKLSRDFEIDGEVIGATQNKNGYVNTTYIVEVVNTHGEKNRYVMQHINNKVFADIDALIANYQFVCNYFNDENVCSSISVPRLINHKSGNSFVKDENGFWRMTECYENIYTLDIPTNTKVFYLAGNYFGRFIKEMSNVDVLDMCETIPDFHNTYKRYKNLEAAITADPYNRVKDVESEIGFIRENIDSVRAIANDLECGAIPTRITHNDTNLNNILFDKNTNKPVAIIDLDTVMPSSALYDYGDSLRIGTNSVKDDETDISRVFCRLDYYEAYTNGWLKACGDILTEREIELLPQASTTITMEDGIRFLEDYINGDTYYKINYPRQNLDRSRTQLALVRDMINNRDKIIKITDRLLNELGLN